MTRTSVVLACLAVLFMARGAIAEPEPALRDSLLARPHKAPIYFAASEAGLVATDGTWSAPLVPGAIQAAAFDRAQDLLWLVRAGRLEVLDLREPAPKPLPIVERWFIATDG